MYILQVQRIKDLLDFVTLYTCIYICIYIIKYMYIHILNIYVSVINICIYIFFLYVYTTGAADKGPIGLRNSARTLGPPGAFRGRVYAPSQAGDTDIVYGKRDLVI